MSNSNSNSSCTSSPPLPPPPTLQDAAQTGASSIIYLDLAIRTAGGIGASNPSPRPSDSLPPPPPPTTSSSSNMAPRRSNNKNNNDNNFVPEAVVGANSPQKPRLPKIVVRFDAYFGQGELADWQRLCHDLGIGGNLSSKTKCCKALEKVMVNIHDLLDAVEAEEQTLVRRFSNRHDLIEYTRRHHKFYPLKHAKEMGPVRALLRHLSHH
ncbi:hypothetical protein B0H63DRAFT_517430 [Podospora didyma]|uniref:Uncharacterized protein n=1 Tax=Podospora didyma TaxID=330526 RepID=A0AAE0U7X2_9PEZI|nr:hypothetical protein B0H63DRAFT_517430 [Podospora didyma]